MSGEFEPNDSRNVTGTASTPDGRWTAQGQQPPLANGQPPMNGGGGAGGSGLSQGEEDEDMDESEGADESDEGSVDFEPDDELIRKVGDDAAGQQQAGSIGEQIREHMRVIGADGEQIGTVDAFENDQIKLTRSGSADGQHHYLPIDRVAGIEGDTIRLHQSGESVFGSNGS